METESSSSKRVKKSKKDKTSKKNKKDRKHKKHSKKHDRHYEERSGGSSTDSGTEKFDLDNAIWVEKQPSIPVFSQDSLQPQTIDSDKEIESISKTVFTDFRNPLNKSSFKKPQNDGIYESSYSENKLSFKRPRSPSPSPSPTSIIDQGSSISATNSSTSYIPSIPPPFSNSATPILSLAELNKLQAKALRARLMNLPNASDLEKEYENAKLAAENNSDDVESDTRVEVLPLLDSQGRPYDLHGVTSKSSQHAGPSRRKKEKVETHDETGQRIRYFSNDDELTLSDMVREERLGSRNKMNSQIVGGIIGDSKFEDDLDYMDDNADKIAKISQKTAEQKRHFAIEDFKKSKQVLENCIYCQNDNSPPKIAMGYRVYLALPNVVEVAEGHCLIVPVQHCSSTLECDDDAWDEIRNFMKCLMQMFAEEDRGVIFMETVVNLKYQNHTVIECIPMPWDLAQDAPAYFKEGIMESSGEWSQNKKLIDTSKAGFRRSMVKELPYFHVWFGLDKGFGHVIEKEKSFPRWFGKEIIAGVCDLPPDVWRRPKKQNPRDNNTRVSKFMNKWKKWDWTTMLEGK
ncbi:43961_t:CDS:2 [Gigaspora margarita]|uniref:43961_t:CDS:1 n=1 Tax=Gigaspora margarita TaxID=4874 RepID=A0ABN7VN68_GIGMA|nr:43961_t:CDS:2 [Gigaspora margarita]